MALNQTTAHRLQQGEITVRQLVKAALDQIGAIDGQVNAFVSVAIAGQRRTAGAALGPLAGIPLGLKDVLSTPYDATAVERLVHRRSRRARRGAPQRALQPRPDPLRASLPGAALAAGRI